MFASGKQSAPHFHPGLASLHFLLRTRTVVIRCLNGLHRHTVIFRMNSLTNRARRPPGEDDEPKTPRPPGAKEPEPDIPEPDEETGDLVVPVQVLPVQILRVETRSGLRPSL